MKYRISSNTAFPLVEVELMMNEEILIEHGSMVYHNGQIELKGKMNSDKGGFGGFMKALGRSMVSGESFFITHVRGLNNNAIIALAPTLPGAIRELDLNVQQWRIRDSSFLACDSGASYEMKRQSFGKAMFGGTGGFFIMETKGTGCMLVNSYGDIKEINLNGGTFIVDNTHVVAWSTSLDYSIKAASGSFGFTTGEGLVNEFRGTGTILIQTRNISSIAEIISPFISKN